MKKIAAPDPGHLYHGVMPGGPCGVGWDVTRDHLRQYEKAAGRSVAWVYFSHEWSEKPAWPVKCDDNDQPKHPSKGMPATGQPVNPAFPWDTVNWIAQAGASPFVRLMLRTSTDPFECEPTFTLSAITNGRFDKDLKTWGAEARAHKVPLICEWGTEMNGMWFPWNAVHNGGPAGGKRFQQAYRHIIDTIGGRDLITWVFHVNGSNEPQTEWNEPKGYDPGPDYTDWIGVSVYGLQDPNSKDASEEFFPQMEKVYPELLKLKGDRPIMVCEFGCTKGNPQVDPAKWADRALSALLHFKQSRWDWIRGFAWWNEGWKHPGKPQNTEMRISEIDCMPATFHKYLVGNKTIVDRPIFR
jgi:hypothetical protein